MNSGLLGSVALLGYAIYTFWSAKNGGLDLNQSLYAKVGIAGLAGSVGTLYNLKDQILEVFGKFKTNGTAKTIEMSGTSVKSLNLTELETQDNYCLNYLTKRISKDKKLNPDSPEDGDTLLKNLVAVFYEIHKRESTKE